MTASSGWRWASIVLGVLVLVLSFSYIARTRVFVGDQIARQIREQAAKRGMDIEVGTIQPYGLWGMSFIDVSVRAPRDAMAIEAQFGRLDFTPELGSLFRGRPVISSIVASDGTLAFVPWTAPKPKVVPTAKSAKSAPKKKVARVETPIEIELHNVQILGPLAGAKPLEVSRLAFVQTGKHPTGLNGYGTFPDGKKFSVRTDVVEGKEHTQIRPDERTQVDGWVGANLPFRLSSKGFTICLQCEQNQFVVHDIELNVPNLGQARLTAPEAELTRDGRVFRLNTLEMEIDHERAERFGARISNMRIDLDTGSRELAGRFNLADPAGGTLAVDWEFDDEFELTFWAKDFALENVWKALDLEMPIRPGRLNGTLKSVIDPSLKFAELEGALTFSKLGIDIKRISSQVLEFEQIKFAGHALIDVEGRAVSVSEGRVKLGAAEPIRLRGQWIEAHQGASFFAHLEADDLSAITFRDGLPKQLTEITEGALLDGKFGFSLTIGGHSAFADSLYLNGELTGDVTIQRDSPNADILSLNTNGPPPMLTTARLENWRSYGQLPDLVPTVMLAAEDASFFRHPGFDWEGFKRAMIHNLEKGTLSRGGSTISQQVVKNLFLTHERSVARKLQEAYLTWRMETEIPKERILEIYINLVEWGSGASGIAQASHLYFDAEPSELSAVELALLASILPNPARFGGAIKKGRLPSSRMHKVGRVLKNLRFMNKMAYGEFRTANEDSLRGTIGRLRLTVCDDDGSVPDAPACY